MRAGGSKKAKRALRGAASGRGIGKHANAHALARMQRNVVAAFTGSRAVSAVAIVSRVRVDALAPPLPTSLYTLRGTRSVPILGRLYRWSPPLTNSLLSSVQKVLHLPRAGLPRRTVIGVALPYSVHTHFRQLVEQQHCDCRFICRFGDSVLQLEPETPFI